MDKLLLAEQLTEKYRSEIEEYHIFTGRHEVDELTEAPVLLIRHGLSEDNFTNHRKKKAKAL